MVELSKENIDEYFHKKGWLKYRKITVTEMQWLSVPESEEVKIHTREGWYVLPGGWLGLIALDPDGFPYPVDQDVFWRTYERAE